MSRAVRPPGEQRVFSRSGKILVFRGGLLPPYCVRCGLRAEKGWSERFSWTPATFELLDIVSVFISHLPFGGMRKEMEIEIPVCDECYRRRKKLRWYAAIPLIGGIPLIFALVTFLGGDHVLAAVLSGAAVLLAGAVTLDRADRGLNITANRITEKYVLMSGASQEFLRRLPEYGPAEPE